MSKTQAARTATRVALRAEAIDVVYAANVAHDNNMDTEIETWTEYTQGNDVACSELHAILAGAGMFTLATPDLQGIRPTREGCYISRWIDVTRPFNDRELAIAQRARACWLDAVVYDSVNGAELRADGRIFRKAGGTWQEWYAQYHAVERAVEQDVVWA